MAFSGAQLGLTIVFGCPGEGGTNGRLAKKFMKKPPSPPKKFLNWPEDENKK
jgi:hypothetical protein